MRRVLFAVVAAMLVTTTQATAQSDFWSGVTADAIANTMANQGGRGFEASIRCLRGGEVVPERRVLNAREAAQETMTRYFTISRTSAPEGLDEIFARAAKDNAVHVNGESLDLSVSSDPLAAMLDAGVPIPEPESFVVSGDRETALGIWSVRDAAGASQGYYEAMFSNRGRRLLGLNIVLSAEPPQSIRPYCRTPGDIDAYRVNYDADWNFIGVRPDTQPLTSSKPPPAAE